MTTTLEGQCLCGAVRVSADVDEQVVDACQCTMCRQWSGGAYVSTRRATHHSIEGEEHVGRYRSSDWAERGFCRNCGSNLYFSYLPKNSISFAAGLFRDADAYPLVEEIFVDQQAKGSGLAGDHKRLTREEVIAEYAPDLSAPED